MGARGFTVPLRLVAAGFVAAIPLLPGIPDFETLQKTGVARLSLGPGFLKIAINAMKNTAEKLLQYKGMDEVKENPVTTAYLNSLINNNR